MLQLPAVLMDTKQKSSVGLLMTAMHPRSQVYSPTHMACITDVETAMATPRSGTVR